METRMCKTCEEELELTENFYVCNVIDGKRYYRRECKSCKSSEEVKRSIKRKKWFQRYKKDLECERCGFDDHRALQFHHIKGDKVDSVSRMVQDNYCKENIIKEIEKCEALCANCHSIEHYKNKTIP